MNKWIGIGKVFHTPKLTFAGTDKQKLTLTIVTSELSEGGDDASEFHTVVVYGHGAAIWSESAQKGDILSVVGELKYHSSERTGNKRVATIEAVEIRLVHRDISSTTDEVSQHNDAPF